MYINRINIKNFRNYESLDLELSSGINIIYGKNAQGKTNLLESIYVLGLTKSHRSFIDGNLIKKGEDTAYLGGVIVTDSIRTKLEIGIDSKRKKLKIDNTEVKKLSEYLSNMKIIIFYPDDLELIKGAPNIRRRYLNTEICQLYGNYINLLNDYTKLLKMRNDLLKHQLKEEIDDNYFQIITNYLIEKAISIYKMRKKFIDELNEKSPEIYENITGNKGFSLVYKPSIDFSEYKLEIMKEEMNKKFEHLKNAEKKLGVTLVGPHRDDFEFFLEDKNIKNFGSQGQQRVSILALKLAEIEIFKKKASTEPILLLDDVFSELDGIKKTNLLGYINSGIQTILTTTDLANIEESILKNAQKIEIENAQIISIEKVE